MISGIMPCAKWDEIGYPWRKAISCWATVCDEIILVVNGFAQAQSFIGEAMRFNDENHRAGKNCNIDVRSIMCPELKDFGGYGSYLMYGICLASDPDWMIAIEADYLISPEAGKRLREKILKAPSETELVTAKAVTMNYTGTRRVFLPDFQNWFTPWDGFSWERPICSRVSMGVFPGMYLGIDRFNYHNTCEGFIRLRKGAPWGATYHSKNIKGYGSNGFKILDTGIEFEHLTFTKNVNNIVEKLKSDDGYFIKQNIGIQEIVNGTHPHGVVYDELSGVKQEYAEREQELLGRIGK